jgi:hypothetical protein
MRVERGPARGFPSGGKRVEAVMASGLALAWFLAAAIAPADPAPAEPGPAVPPPGQSSVIVAKLVSDFRIVGRIEPEPGDESWDGTIFEAQFRVERRYSGPLVGRTARIRFAGNELLHLRVRPQMVMVVDDMGDLYVARWWSWTKDGLACVPRWIIEQRRIVFSRRPARRNPEGDPCFRPDRRVISDMD